MKISDIMQILKQNSLFKAAYLDSSNPELTQICTDSRRVKPGSLFMCIEGFVSDGHNFAEQAIANGAELLIVTKTLSLDIPQIQVNDARKATALLARKFFRDPTSKFQLIGVTGTNGKTTVTNIIKELLVDRDKKIGLIGTFGYSIDHRKYPTARTTPDIIDLNEIFQHFVAENVEVVIMEVSSHALALDRVFGLNFDAAVFTNLSQDHLDFHNNIQNYADEKFKLFHYTALNGGIQIFNSDDATGKEFYKRSKGNKISFGKNAEDIKIFDITNNWKNCSFKLKYNNKDLLISSELLGEFNVYNITAALVTCKELYPEIKIENLINRIKSLSPVKGRLEKMQISSTNVFIDYAHTPDALANVLRTLQELHPNRIITVFGAGGDRDRSKRPKMLAEAKKYSELCIITNDNPRDEYPATIIRDITQDANFEDNLIIIQDRAKAIATALNLAQKDDFILIAGKGHEEYQEIKGQRLEFSDKQVVLGHKSSAQGNLQIPLDPLYLEYIFQYKLQKTSGLLYNLSTDSRNIQEKTLFFAFEGENFDGHNFVPNVLASGNWAVVNKTYDGEHPHLIKVEDTIEAYGLLAQKYIKLFDIVKIGITGSFGKTTTKEMLYNILVKKAKTLKTYSNENNLIGLPKTIFKLTPEHRYGIFELGSNHFGEIEKLTEILKPEIAVVTAIGASHLEFLQDIDGVYKEKSAILRKSPRVRIFPGKFPQFKEFKGISFGYSPDDDYTVSQVCSDHEKTEFKINEEAYSLPTPFKQFALNAAIVVAICKELKLKEKTIRSGLQQPLNIDWRMQLEKRGKRHLLIDCYNANPDSMKAAIDFWKDYLPHLPHIAILGDMLELGDLTKNYHKKIWQQLKNIDYELLISVGELAKEYQADKHFNHVDELLASHELNKLPGKAVILIKASHGISLEKILDRID